MGYTTMKPLYALLHPPFILLTQPNAFSTFPNINDLLNHALKIISCWKDECQNDFLKILCFLKTLASMNFVKLDFIIYNRNFPQVFPIFAVDFLVKILHNKRCEVYGGNLTGFCQTLDVEKTPHPLVWLKSSVPLFEIEKKSFFALDCYLFYQ